MSQSVCMEDEIEKQSLGNRTLSQYTNRYTEKTEDLVI
jgi:hypothetical protein